MTAPAEDPRGGELCRCGLSRGAPLHGNPFGAGHTYDPRPPAAGRGDTDGGGEACGDPFGGIGCPVPGCTHGWAARPAGDRAQPTEELREAIAAWEFARHAPARYWGSGALWGEEADARLAADELLALPELVALLDAQAADRAKVARVEALAEEYRIFGMVLHDVKQAELFADVAKELRRALGGTT